MQPGTKFGILFNFRGTDYNFKVGGGFLNADEKKTGRWNGMEVLYEPTKEGEWGIAMSHLLTFPEKADYSNKFETSAGVDLGGKFCINFLIQLEVGCEVNIDNVRIVTKDASGQYKDLKGNVVEIPLSSGSASNGSANGSAGTSDILDFNWGKKNNNQTDNKTEQTDTDTKNNQNDSKSYVTIIIIAAVCVAVIAAGTVGFLVLRKKRKNKTAE